MRDWKRVAYPAVLIMVAVASATGVAFALNEAFRPELRIYALQLSAIVSAIVATPICLFLAYKENQVAEARDRAEAAARAKTQFLANMSHEIRTPMNGVIGMANLLRDTSLTPRQHEMIDVIVSSSDSLLKIINDILDFSRLEAGKLVMAAEPFRLDLVVEDVAALLAPRVEEKKLELTVRYQPDLPVAFIGDAGRLRQVLVNLVSNAVKFTDTGQISIDVSGAARGDVCELDVSVADTGCGVPADKLEAIFEKFEQVDGSSARRFDGAGLGLSISKQIIQAFAGRICAQSVLGEGSQFRFAITLPIDPDGVARVANIESLAGARALVVDDNAVNRRILSEQLHNLGLAVEVAASGEEALRLVGQGAQGAACRDRYSIAIIDFQMPGMDGRSLAQALREGPFGRTPIVLLTSAHQAGEDPARGDRLFDAVLTKPARATLVVSTLTELLSLARPSAALFDAPCALSAAETQSRSASLKVLVAEDNLVNQMVVQAMLEKLGCRVIMVADGRAAIAAYREERPDLVLMDISMPIMGGEEAAAGIRAVQAASGRSCPIIAVTAHAMKEDAERFLAAGMDDCVTKPLTTRTIERLVLAWGLGEEPLAQTG